MKVYGEIAKYSEIIRVYLIYMRQHTDTLYILNATLYEWRMNDYATFCNSN